MHKVRCVGDPHSPSAIDPVLPDKHRAFLGHIDVSSHRWNAAILSRRERQQDQHTSRQNEARLRRFLEAYVEKASDAEPYINLIT